MPELARFYGIVIAMYFRDHPPPHFHAKYGGDQAVIEIRTLQVVAGWLPPRALGLAVEWGARHQAELLADWELARKELPLRPIEPLE